MTLAEQERHAYITGDTKTAKLLSKLIDSETDSEGEEPSETYNRGYDDGYYQAQRDSR